MGKCTVESLHKNIQDQFDIMHGLVTEIRSLKEDGSPEAMAQANRLADILTKLSEKAYRMNQIVREAA